MMYHKALLFSDPTMASRILHTPNPKTQQALGRKVQGFDKQKWDAEKSGIVEEGNWWKFAGGKDAEGGDLGKRLVETGGRELVEVGLSFFFGMGGWGVRRGGGEVGNGVGIRALT